jgi:hypothetical protein
MIKEHDQEMSKNLKVAVVVAVIPTILTDLVVIIDL